MPLEENKQVPPSNTYPHIEVINKDKQVKQVDFRQLIGTDAVDRSRPRVRNHGNLSWQCYDLDKNYNWAIGYDSNNALILMPTLKS